MPHRYSAAVTERAGLWYALAAAFLFGVSGVVAADAFESIEPIRVAQIRSVIAALVLGAIAYRRRRTVHGGRLPELFAFGALLAAVTITFYLAIDRIGVGPGVTLQFLGPAMVLVWMKVVQRRSIATSAWIATGAAATGVALVTRAWDLASLDALGVLAGIGAAASFAGYLLLGERLGKSLPGLSIAAYGFAFSALILVVAVPIDIPEVSGVVWGQVLWISLAGTALPFLLEIAAVRRADPGRVGVVATGEPVIATATAWVVLGQALTPAQVVGASLVVAGVASIQLLTHSVAPDLPPSAV